MQNAHFKIVTTHFEGPFDLLLFFIERDELDIQDIPISQITDDFLQYIQKLEKVNIDSASEFILVASKLMRIKAKMLLPRKEIDEFGNEVDPREELVQKLLEYKKYKETIDSFKNLELIRSTRLERGNLKNELKKIGQKALVDIELEGLSLFKLFNAYQKLLANVENRQRKAIHNVISYPFTIETQQTLIYKKLKKFDKVDFQNLFAPIKTRIEAIITFLAILEMINSAEIKVLSTIEPNSLILTKTS